MIVSTRSNSIPEHVDTWTESKVGTGPRTFIAIWKCDPFFSKGDACWDGSSSGRSRRAAGDTVDVTIGGESCDGLSSGTHCNGPLDPTTVYFFTLRGYTENGLYEDTDPSQPVVTSTCRCR